MSFVCGFGESFAGGARRAMPDTSETDASNSFVAVKSALDESLQN